MPKLTYWVMEHKHDSSCYSIIAKTRKAALAMAQERGQNDYEPPIKRELHYRDAFDLFEQATGDGGGRW